MPEILAGAGILFGILILMRLFVSANPGTLAVGVRYAGVGALGLTAATLFYLRRIDLGLLAAGMAYGLFTNGHILPRGFPFGMFFPYGGASSRRRRRGPSAGQSSKVATAWLELELEHDS